MNEKLKLGIVGAGSIGIRHLFNILEVLKERKIEGYVDLIRSGHGRALDSEVTKVVNHIYDSSEDIPSDYDILFITNPTNLHYDTIKQYGLKTLHMFIEKPVFDRVDIDLEELRLREDHIYYVACPLRYTNVIQYLKKHCSSWNIYNARVICSSYLPDWRPNQDYRTTYSAHLEQGGGVSIDLIHEWDYISYLFGQPEQVLNMKGHYSNLEIDSDDLSLYLAKYHDMLIEVHLDYFGRQTIREIQLFTDTDTIIGDIANSEIRYLKSGEVLSLKENRNDFYKKEMEHFFDIIEGKANNENDIATALNTLRITKVGK